MVNESGPGSKYERQELLEFLLKADFDKRKEFHDIVELAAILCDKPVALITILDGDGNWVKMRIGVDYQMMPKETSFCEYVIENNELIVVPDAAKDARFYKSEAVKSDPQVRFYAGVPLVLGNGLKLGTLCLFDLKPNNLTDIQKGALTVLARQVIFLIELELRDKLLNEQLEEIKSKNDSLVKIAYIQSHDIRQPLTTIMGLVGLVRDGYQEVDDQWVEMISQTTYLLDQRIRAIAKESLAEKDIKALRFNKMVEEIEDYAILLLDRDGSLENWNKGAEIVKGYKAHEVIGKNFSIFYTAKDLATGIPQLLIQQAAENGSAKTEGWRVRKDGSLFWARVLITAIHDDSGEVIGFTKVTRLLPHPGVM